MIRGFVMVRIQRGRGHPGTCAMRLIKWLQLLGVRGGSERPVRTSAWMWLLGSFMFTQMIHTIWISKMQINPKKCAHTLLTESKKDKNII